MSMIGEFREFAVKGNVVDLAVGIIMGGAFGKITSSLVADVIMPPLGMLIGGVDFSNLKATLKAAQGEAAAVTLNYGLFIQTVVDFVIVAFAMFLLVKAINAMKRAQPADANAAPSKQEVLLTEIRDLLRK